MTRILRCSFTIITLCLSLPIYADGNPPFYWEFINVDIDVQKNGDLVITETQKYVFQREHPNIRYRWLPLNKIESIEDITVSENNQRLPIEITKSRHKIKIQWQHSLTPPENHTFVIKYRVIGGIQTSDNVDQVYWKAIFKERAYRVDHAQVRVRFPDNIFAQILETKSFGVPSSITKTSRQGDQSTLFTAGRVLLPNEALEILVSFPHGILDLRSRNTAEPLPMGESSVIIIAWLIGSYMLFLFVIKFAMRKNILPSGYKYSYIAIIVPSFIWLVSHTHMVIAVFVIIFMIWLSRLISGQLSVSSGGGSSGGGVGGVGGVGGGSGGG